MGGEGAHLLELSKVAEPVGRNAQLFGVPVVGDANEIVIFKIVRIQRPAQNVDEVLEELSELADAAQRFARRGNRHQLSSIQHSSRGLGASMGAFTRLR